MYILYVSWCWHTPHRAGDTWALLELIVLIVLARWGSQPNLWWSLRKEGVASWQGQGFVFVFVANLYFCFFAPYTTQTGGERRKECHHIIKTSIPPAGTPLGAVGSRDLPDTRSTIIVISARTSNLTAFISGQFGCLSTNEKPQFGWMGQSGRIISISNRWNPAGKTVVRTREAWHPSFSVALLWLELWMIDKTHADNVHCTLTLIPLCLGLMGWPGPGLNSPCLEAAAPI